MALKETSKKRKGAPAFAEDVEKPRKKAQVASKTSNGKKVTEQARRANAADLNAAEDSSSDDAFAGFGSDDEASADRTADLLKGFESSSSDDERDESQRAIADTAIPAPPPTAAHALKHQPKAAAADTPGTLYVGRIPHGFYEHQMRAYFGQFGTVARLRLARNRRTGASKHYAFVQFASREVAGIVADTMNNYLMFGHILKVSLLAEERVAEMEAKGLWKGEGSRFKRVPWGNIEKGRLRSTDRDGWAKRIKSEETRRRKKQEKLKELGYEFAVTPVKGVDAVPVKESLTAEISDAVDEVKQLEAPQSNAENDLGSLLAAQKTKTSKKADAEALPSSVKKTKKKRKV